MNAECGESGEKRLETQSITTYEELYRKLQEHDTEQVMLRVTGDVFTISLDKHLEINVYDNNGEVYLEIALDGKQMTHWHPDYQEAYNELHKYVEKPAETLEELKREMESYKEKASGCMMFYLLWLVFLFVILFVLTELKEVYLSLAWELAAYVGLPVLMAAAFTLVFTRRARGKVKKKKVEGSAGRMRTESDNIDNSDK